MGSRFDRWRLLRAMRWFPRWFTGPVNVDGPAPDARHANLLAAVILCVLAGVLVHSITSFVMEPKSYTEHPSDYALIGAIFIVFLVLLFLIGRIPTRHAARLALIAFSLVIFVELLLIDEQSDPWDLTYLIIPLIAGGVFLGKIELALFAALNIAAMLLIPVFLPRIELYSLPILFYGMTSAIVLIGKRHLEILGALRQTRLAETELRYRSVVEQVNDIVWRMDAHGCFTFISPLSKRLLGYKPEELLGKPFETVLTPASGRHAREVLESRLRGDIADDQVTLELIHRRKDGTEFTGEARTTAIFSAKESAFEIQGITRDITERKLAEQERQRLETQLSQVQKMEAIGQLAGGVAHDFNNLLQVISGAAEMALLEVPAGAPGHDELNEIRTATQRAANLVRQLLTFSRRESFRRVSVDVHALVSNFSRMLRRVIGEDMDIELQLEDGLPAVHADPGQIETALMNLCVNARDAMPNGGRITIRSSVYVPDERFLAQHTEAPPGPFVVLSITDTGSGMTGDVIEHVFEPFFTTKGVGKGTGLGLASVYGIVHQHDGIIECSSQLGAGSTFRIYLPAQAADTVRDLMAADGAEAPRGGAETILLAEDDELVRGISQRILHIAGYHVLLAKNGQEAIELFEKNRGQVHLAILDVVMPVMNGREAAERMRAIRPDLPILFSSGYDFSILEGRLTEKERVNLVHKPFNPRTFLHHVRALLDGTPIE